MNWIARMLHRRPYAAPAPVLAPSDRNDLAAAKEAHKRLLSRADHAIQEAMAHADEVFRYHGPDRRRKPR